jgi:hypothetical protein
MPVQMDTAQQGYEMFYYPWQITTLKYLINIRPNGANSKQVYDHVNTVMPISRASVINYLNAMVEDRLLTYTEKTGKGGYHRIYTIRYSEPELRQHIAQTLITKLQDEYPQETRHAIQHIS